METLLKDITFREVSLSTNRPTRNRPGREWTRWSDESDANTADDAWQDEIHDGNQASNDITPVDSDDNQPGDDNTGEDDDTQPEDGDSTPVDSDDHPVD